ncbi:hypothetical protein ACOMHN_017694 [Nucella lapillus]
MKSKEAERERPERQTDGGGGPPREEEDRRQGPLGEVDLHGRRNAAMGRRTTTGGGPPREEDRRQGPLGEVARGRRTAARGH